MLVAARPLLVLPMAAAALLACGSDTPTAGTGDSSTELQISVDRGDGTTTVHTLTCDPAGGDHPDPEGACALVDAAASLTPNPLQPVPSDVACTEIYGGPATATVTGTLDGDPATIEFSRVNGCEIDRWDAALALLAEPAGSGP